MKKNTILIELGLLMVLIFIGMLRASISCVDTLSVILYDCRLQLTMPSTVDNRIVIA